MMFNLDRFTMHTHSASTAAAFKSYPLALGGRGGKWVRSALAAAAGFVVASAAHAQAFDAVRLYGAAPGSDGGLFGAALLNVPQYSGATDQRWMLLPLLDYQWKSGWFAGTSNGVGMNFSGNPAQQYGVRLTADIGRNENRSPALRGMGDVGPSLEAGGFFNQYLSPETFLTSSLRYGAGRQHDGV